MQNSYIVDTFLSGALWMILIYLFFEVKYRLNLLDQIMSVTMFSTAINDVVKAATLITLPFSLIFIFLLWRFHSLMVTSQSWGYGGMGLLIIIGLIGLPLIWVQITLILIQRGPFVELSQRTSALNQQGGFR